MTSAAEIYEQAFYAGLRPEPLVSVSAHAEEHLRLPRKGSPEPGRYRLERTPYMREILDNMSVYSGVIEQVTMKCTQAGFSQGMIAWFSYIIDVAPGPTMMFLPTVDLARSFSRQKLAPTFDETPKLKGKIREPRARDSGNTILEKEFPSGALLLGGSNSGSFFRQRSIRFLALDDIDGYEAEVAEEGNPISLAEKRTGTFGRRKKIWKNSSPTIKGISAIEREYEESSQALFHVPCPLCGAQQALVWGGRDWDHGVKFRRDEAGEVVEAWYVCKFCHGRIDEHYKTAIFNAGVWVHAHPERAKRGYQLSALYYPLGWDSWAIIADEFVKAKGKPHLLQTWTNTRLGLPYEAKGEQPEWALVKARAESYEMWTAPERALLLVAAVDVQADRLELIIKAYGPQEESWLIYFGQIWGGPLQAETWNQLDGILNRSIQGRQIVSMAVDSGYATQAVYNYVRHRGPRVIAVKGAKELNKPVVGRPTAQDINWLGETIKGGVLLWPIGTATAKATIYGRLQIVRPDRPGPIPGYMHFPIGLPDEYYLQLTAEKLVTKFVGGYPVPQWVPIRERNEALDLEVYAYAAAIRAGLVFLDRPAGAARPAAQNQKPRTERDGPRVKGERPGWLNR